MKTFKKILLFICSILLLVNSGNTYSYSPSIKDEEVLKKIYKIVNSVHKKNPGKIGIVKNKATQIKKDYLKSDRIIYIMDQIINHIGDLGKENLVEKNNSICEHDLGYITKDFNKTTITVSNYNDLYKAITKNINTEYLEIIIKSGTYNISKPLWIKNNNIIFRGETGNASDIVLKGQSMTSGVSHAFMVAGKNIYIGDLTIENVKNHPIQIHGEKDADNTFIHNVEIYDAGEQMIKGSYDKNTMIGTDNGIIQCSHFEYKKGIGPQYYIGGIDIHNGKNWIVRNNTFKNIISPESRLAEHAIHFWSDSENTLVENNIIINSDRGIGFGLGSRGHKGGIIRNNIIYHNSSKGDVGIGLENAYGVKVYNNTIYQEHSYPNAIEYRFSGTEAVIENNLTNKKIAKRNDGKATLNNNYEDARLNFFNNIEKYDFDIINIPIKKKGIGAGIKNFFDEINSKNQETNNTKQDILKGEENTKNEIIKIDTFEKNGNFSRTLYVGKDQKHKTLKEINNIVQAGDKIILKSGIYSGGNYMTKFQGTEENPIKIIGEGNVIFNGGNTGIQFVNPKFLIIENITISGSRDNGMNIDDGGDYNTPASNIIIKNITIKNIGNGGNNDNLKLSGVDNFYIINSNFKDGSSGGSGIDMVGCHNGQILNNNFYNLGSNFIQAKGGTSDILIKNNFLEKVIHRGINMGGSTGAAYFRPSISSAVNYEAKNIKVIKNTFVDVNSGVAFVGCINCEAKYNIIYKPKSWAFRILQETIQKDGVNFIKSSNGEFSKNIIVFEKNLKRFVNIGPNTDSKSFKFNNNMWYCLDDKNYNYYYHLNNLPTKEENSISGINPLFEDTINKNFSLKKESQMYSIFKEIK